MTLPEAIHLADRTFPEFSSPEAITPEGLVRMIYENAVCLNEPDSFRIYGDGVLIGESQYSPIDAWIDASTSLPPVFLDGFEQKDWGTNQYFHKEGYDQTSPRYSGNEEDS